MGIIEPKPRAMKGHQSAAAETTTWLTPPAILRALGPFDLDPCAAPSPRPWPTAAEHYELPEDGLMLPWRVNKWTNQDGVCTCLCHHSHAAPVFKTSPSKNFIRVGNPLVNEDMRVGAKNAAGEKKNIECAGDLLTTLTQEPKIPVSLNVCEKESAKECDGARDANTSKSPRQVILGLKVSTLLLGAKIAIGHQREKGWPKEERTQKTQQKSEKKSSGIANLKKDEPLNESIALSQTLEEGRDIRTGRLYGPKKTGQRAKRHGKRDALIVETGNVSLKTILSRSVLKGSPEPFAGICSLPVRPVIAENKAKTHSVSAENADGCLLSCPSCLQKECRLSSHPARVWINPPFGRHTDAWLNRAALHSRATVLLPAATETERWFRYVWGVADAVCFLQARPHFHYPDGTRAAANSGCAIALVAYGQEEAAALRRSGLGHVVKANG